MRKHYWKKRIAYMLIFCLLAGFVPVGDHVYAEEPAAATDTAVVTEVPDTTDTVTPTPEANEVPAATDTAVSTETSAPTATPTATPEETTAPTETGEPAVVPTAEPSPTAIIDGLKAQITITVDGEKPEDNTIELQAYKKSVKKKKGNYIGKDLEKKLKATIKVDDSNNLLEKNGCKLTYKSMNKEIATVTGAGIIRGKKMGKTSIEIEALMKNDGSSLGILATIDITVKPTIYIQHLTGKKYVKYGKKKYFGKKAIRFKVVGCDKPFYLNYKKDGKKNFEKYMKKKWSKNTKTILKSQWIPLSGNSFRFRITTTKGEKSNELHYLTV